MIKRTLLIFFIAVNALFCGINITCLKQNKIYYFFDWNNGSVNKINAYAKNIEPLPIHKIPLFLTDFCWGREPSYIFCEDKTIYTSTSLQVKALLDSAGKKCIHIALQNEGLEQNIHKITCIFPDWPGLDKVSKTAAYDANRGIMLFPLIPMNPRWHSNAEGITIYTDFWKEFNNCVLGEKYVTRSLNAGTYGHLCIALPCLVNYCEDTLSFFCPMKNAGFSLNLQTNAVRFSDQLYVVTDPKQCTFCMDIWTRRTQIKGVSVRVFQ